MTSDTTQIALAFLDDIARSGMKVAALRHAAADVVWWLPGSVRDDALRGMDEVVSWFDARGDLNKLFHVPPEMVIERVVVDGNVAVVQMWTRGLTVSGKNYDNRYMLVIIVEDGQITEIREFYDTKHVLDTFHREPSTAN
jgi:uncharacterized protein